MRKALSGFIAARSTEMRETLSRRLKALEKRFAAEIPERPADREGHITFAMRNALGGIVMWCQISEEDAAL